MITSCKLTIFEGPDGAGKSTAAKRFAEQTDAVYVHFPALPGVTRGLGRLYVEAMLPALLGYQDVVFDRCWLSEVPYGNAFRQGLDRLGEPSRRMLERLALRCGAVVVRCLPTWEVVEANYRRRRHLELLENEAQLLAVYEAYQTRRPGLPVITYDYTMGNLSGDAVESLRHARHPLAVQSAGNLDRPRIVLIGEGFAERKDQDPWYQSPFMSFTKDGCSQWLTERLMMADVREDELLWVNADQDLSLLHDLPTTTKIVALGDAAAEELYQLKTIALKVPHPQSWKRFHHHQRYPLLDVLDKGD